jgi:hypothetical protein
MNRFLGLMPFVLVSIALLQGPNVFPKDPSPELFAHGSRSSGGQSMFQALSDLESLFSREHSFHWNHPTPHIGRVTTAMTYAPVNFEGCTVIWTQTQEGLGSGLIYIATRRFSVPLALMDPKKISVEPVSSGPEIRPGIEPGDYFTVRLQTIGGRKSVSIVDNDIEFDDKKGPISTVHQLLVSEAWVRVRREETAELMETQFQKTVSACATAGQ